MSITLSSTKCKLSAFPWKTQGSRPDGFWTWNNGGQGDASGGDMFMKGNMTGRELADRIISLEALNAFSPDGTAAQVGDLMLVWWMRSQNANDVSATTLAFDLSNGSSLGLFLSAPFAPRTPKGMISLGTPVKDLGMTTVYDVVGAAFSVNTNLINYYGAAFGYWWDRERVIREAVGLDFPYAA